MCLSSAVSWGGCPADLSWVLLSGNQLAGDWSKMALSRTTRLSFMWSVRLHRAAQACSCGGSRVPGGRIEACQALWSLGSELGGGGLGVSYLQSVSSQICPLLRQNMPQWLYEIEASGILVLRPHVTCKIVTKNTTFTWWSLSSSQVSIKELQKALKVTSLQNEIHFIDICNFTYLSLPEDLYICNTLLGRQEEQFRIHVFCIIF